MNKRTFRLLCSVFAAHFFVACGGSGDGTSGGSETTVPTTPTVSLSVNPASITIGESTGLTWTSNYATSCTASGAWSGDRSLNGSEQSNTFDTAGNYNFELKCIGDGAEATANLR